MNKIGLFDEQFHLWYEEVDYCKRVSDAGHKIMFYPESQITHVGGQSFSQLKVYERKKIATRSLLHYFKKNKPIWQRAILRAIMPIVLALTWVMNLINPESSLAGWYTKGEKLEVESEKLFWPAR